MSRLPVLKLVSIVAVANRLKPCVCFQAVDAVAELLLGPSAAQAMRSEVLRRYLRGEQHGHRRQQERLQSTDTVGKRYPDKSTTAQVSCPVPHGL